jgi:hypothetical protein
MGLVSSQFSGFWWVLFQFSTMDLLVWYFQGFSISGLFKIQLRSVSITCAWEKIVVPLEGSSFMENISSVSA